MLSIYGNVLSMSFKIGSGLLIVASAVYGQPKQTVGQFGDLVERIRLSYNSVTKADLDRTEKNLEWARQYLGRTWRAILLTRGRTYQPPLVIDGGRESLSQIPWKCSKGTIFQFDNAAYCPVDNMISYDGFYLAGLSKKVGQQNHSPGDFAAIVGLAHEHRACAAASAWNHRRLGFYE